MMAHMHEQDMDGAEVGLFDDEAAQAIGTKVIEMADRVKVCHATLPGSRAVLAFTIDGVRFDVVVTVAPDSK